MLAFLYYFFYLFILIITDITLSNDETSDRIQQEQNTTYNGRYMTYTHFIYAIMHLLNCLK